MKVNRFFFVAVLLMVALTVSSQTFNVSGIIHSDQGEAVEAEIFVQPGGEVFYSDKKGKFLIENVEPGTYYLTIYAISHTTAYDVVEVLDKDVFLDIVQNYIETELEEVTIHESQNVGVGYSRLKPIEGTAIYAAKKNEVILLDQMTINKAANNARQTFSKISGANIWESDCAGLQIGIATRGLSPSRNSNFNTRQNGYDISADPLGYPESYYTPPIQGVEQIQIVRGASSLQYGTQFGGLVNFVMKRGKLEEKINFITDHSYNSLGYYNNFNSISGGGKKVAYNIYNRFTIGNCWRCNSDFLSTNGGVLLDYYVNDKVKLSFDYSKNYYRTQQSGGVTDKQFNEDAQQSNRARNWFLVDWNLMALNGDFHLTDKSRMDVKLFGLIATRKSLGNLERIDRIDDGSFRILLDDQYKNIGAESRFIQRYNIKENPSNFLVGIRYFRGHTDRDQGEGVNGSNADFEFLNPDSLSTSHEFPNNNVAIFTENVFQVSPKWSITPGLRFEYIQTKSDGTYRNVIKDLAGNILLDTLFEDSQKNQRTILLGGIGISYKPNEKMELYGNISQNYRAINFNDLRVINPNLQVDPNLKDEKGFNADLGFRGTVDKTFTYDASLFFLKYNDRIGSILINDGGFNKELRTNIADARIFGLESFFELSLSELFLSNEQHGLSVFTNLGFTYAKYINAQTSAIEGNDVELVPPVTFKTGLNYSFKDFKIGLLYSLVTEHFSDASNVGKNGETISSAIKGIIPTYDVLDISFSYSYKFLKVETGVNNIFNEIYFTRRASGYPGPGILPSSGINFYCGLIVQLIK